MALRFLLFVCLSPGLAGLAGLAPALALGADAGQEALSLNLPAFSLESRTPALTHAPAPLAPTASSGAAFAPAPGLLLLPSALALSEREKRAVLAFRNRGGSVLATWWSGTHGENGRKIGPDFMAQALDAEVAGDTQASAQEEFLIPHGNSALVQYLPGGARLGIASCPGA